MQIIINWKLRKIFEENILSHNQTTPIEVANQISCTPKAKGFLNIIDLHVTISLLKLIIPRIEIIMPLFKSIASMNMIPFTIGIFNFNHSYQVDDIPQAFTALSLNNGTSDTNWTTNTKATAHKIDSHYRYFK